MPLDIFISEDAIRVHLLQDASEIIKSWVQLPEIIGTQLVRLRPMGSPLMTSEDSLKMSEKDLIGNIQSVGSSKTPLITTFLMGSPKQLTCIEQYQSNTSVAHCLDSAKCHQPPKTGFRWESAALIRWDLRILVETKSVTRASKLGLARMESPTQS